MIENIIAEKSYTGFTVLTLLFLLASAALIASNRTVDYRPRRIFLMIIGIIAFATSADWLTAITAGIPEFRFAHSILIGTMFATVPTCSVMIAEAIFPSKASRWILVVLAAHAVFELAGIFGGWVFWVDEFNIYHRSYLYFVYTFVYGLASIFLVVESIRMGHVYQSGIVAILLVLTCLVTGVFIQLVDATIRTTWPAVSITLVLYFVYYSDMVLRADTLTKLLNRHSFDEFAARPELPCIVIMADLNDFKLANDAQGHAYGDKCLATVADAIMQTFAHVGYAYRTGGDEFVIIMTDKLSEVDSLCNELTAAIARARKKDAHIPSIAIGHALAPAGCKDFNKVVEDADRAMYEAKKK